MPPKRRLSKRKMVVITVSISENSLDIIDKYMANKDYGFYASRSEFVRVAIITQLKEDLSHMEQIADRIEEYETQDSKYIKIPYENGESKVYKIVRRLEY